MGEQSKPHDDKDTHSEHSTSIGEPAAKRQLETLDALRAYFDPLRQRIIQEIARESKTVHQIADVLEVPFTRLYYHIKMLEQHHIVQVVDIVSGLGAVEQKYYRVSAWQFIVKPELLSHRPTDEAIPPGIEALLEIMIEQTSDDIRRSITRGTINLDAQVPHGDALMLRQGVLRMSRDQAANMQRDLIDLMIRYQSQSLSDQPAADYQISLALYPTAFTQMDDS